MNGGRCGGPELLAHVNLRRKRLMVSRVVLCVERYPVTRPVVMFAIKPVTVEEEFAELHIRAGRTEAVLEAIPSVQRPLSTRTRGRRPAVDPAARANAQRRLATRGAGKNAVTSRQPLIRRNVRARTASANAPLPMPSS